MRGGWKGGQGQHWMSSVSAVKKQFIVTSSKSMSHFPDQGLSHPLAHWERTWPTDGSLWAVSTHLSVSAVTSPWISFLIFCFQESKKRCSILLGQNKLGERVWWPVERISNEESDGDTTSYSRNNLTWDLPGLRKDLYLRWRQFLFQNTWNRITIYIFPFQLIRINFKDHLDKMWTCHCEILTRCSFHQFWIVNKPYYPVTKSLFYTLLFINSRTDITIQINYSRNSEMKAGI